MKRSLFLNLFVAAVVTALVSSSLAHITPMVHLVKHNEAVRSLLPGSQQFFVKTVKVGQEERKRIREAAQWTPDLDAYKFYYGKDSSGSIVGDVLLITVNSRHGPLALAVGFSTRNTVTRVIVTDVGVESVAWVRKILATGILDRFAGKNERTVSAVLTEISKREVGRMPYYFAEIITKAVARAAVLQSTLFGFK